MSYHMINPFMNDHFSGTTNGLSCEQLIEMRSIAERFGQSPNTWDLNVNSNSLREIPVAELLRRYRHRYCLSAHPHITEELLKNCVVIAFNCLVSRVMSDDNRHLMISFVRPSWDDERFGRFAVHRNTYNYLTISRGETAVLHRSNTLNFINCVMEMRKGMGRMTSQKKQKLIDDIRDSNMSGQQIDSMYDLLIGIINET